MASRLILHIGTEKTGSTAIQRFLARQGRWLSLQGFRLPQSLGAVEHRRFALLFYQPGQFDDLTQQEGLDNLSAKDLAKTVNQWEDALDHELSQAPNQQWIIQVSISIPDCFIAIPAWKNSPTLLAVALMK